MRESNRISSVSHCNILGNFSIYVCIIFKKHFTKLVIFVLGPYYNLKTFEDFCNRDPETVITAEEPLLQHLQEAPPFGVAYLILSHFYTVDVSV